MCLRIRKAVIKDLTPALQLDQEAFGVDAWTVMDYIGVFSMRGVKKFTALSDDVFAGFAAAEYDRDNKAVCLMTLAVRPEFRRRGIGIALLQHCEEAFVSSPIYLNVDIANIPAIKLYEKAGFRQIGIETAYYLNGHDALIMKKP